MNLYKSVVLSDGRVTLTLLKRTLYGSSPLRDGHLRSGSWGAKNACGTAADGSRVAKQNAGAGWGGKRRLRRNCF